MEIKNLTNPDLLHATKRLVAEERCITTQVLRHLLEIETRRLFAEMGYSSLFEFATRELGYSDSAAYRRISAMRLLKQLPEAEDKIASGTLSVTNASLLQCFFRAAGKEDKSFSVEEKRELLKEISGKSTRECERVFATIAPQAVPREKERAVSKSETEIRFVATEELLEMFKRIRELCAHSLGGQSDYSSLFKLMAEMLLKKINPEKRTSQKAPSATPLPAPKVRSGTSVQRNASSRYIPAQIKQSVWKRDQGMCQYTDPVTSRKCSSSYGLQYDHILPHALGGETIETNLRLLCRQHNRLMAERVFGRSKIQAITRAGSGYGSPP